MLNNYERSRAVIFEWKKKQYVKYKYRRHDKRKERLKKKNKFSGIFAWTTPGVPHRFSVFEFQMVFNVD